MYTYYGAHKHRHLYASFLSLPHLQAMLFRSSHAYPGHHTFSSDWLVATSKEGNSVCNGPDLHSRSYWVLWLESGDENFATVDAYYCANRNA